MEQLPLHIYVAYSDDRSLSLLKSSEDGVMSEVANWPLSGIALPIAVRHDGKGLFVGTFSEDGPNEVDRIDAFKRDGLTGQLSFLSSVETAGRMTHISTDQTDGFLLGASYFAHCVVMHTILENGLLSELSLQMPTGKNAHHILLDASNRFALVPNLGDSQIMQLVFDHTAGRLASNTPAVVFEPDGAGCRHVAHHPSGRFVYLVNERDGSVVCFPFSEGKLGEPLQRVSCLRTEVDDPWASQILITPDGTQLFVGERRTHVLARWKIDRQTGELSDRKIIDVAKNPRSFEIDPSGRLLFLGGLESNVIETYRIDREDGVPDRIATTPSRSGPTWLVAVPAVMDT